MISRAIISTCVDGKFGDNRSGGGRPRQADRQKHN